MTCRKEKENTSILETDPIKDLYDKLDGTRLVKKVVLDDDTVGLIAWYGSHGLHLYDMLCKEIDIRNIGDFSQQSVPFEVAEKEINKWIQDIQDEEV